MTKKTLFVLGLAFAAIVALAQNRILIELTGQGGKGVIAIPDFRGSGDAARFMGTFNTTLWAEIDQSGPLPYGAQDLVSAASSAAAAGYSRRQAPRPPPPRAERHLRCNSRPACISPIGPALL